MCQSIGLDHSIQLKFEMKLHMKMLGFEFLF